MWDAFSGTLVGLEACDLGESPLGWLTGVVGQKLLTWIGWEEVSHTWGRHSSLDEATDAVANIDLTQIWQIPHNLQLFLLNDVKRRKRDSCKIPTSEIYIAFVQKGCYIFLLGSCKIYSVATFIQT